MTITAYETLYESSIAYGVRKALVAEHTRIELDQKLRNLTNNNKDLQSQVESLKSTIESTLTRSAQKREAEEKTHAEEVCIYYIYVVNIYLVFLYSVYI